MYQLPQVHVPADGQRYPQLRSLREQEATEGNDLCGLRQLRRSSEKSKRDNYSERLDKSLSLLKDLAARESPSPEPGISNEVKSAGIDLSFMSEAKTIHQALAQRWCCSCWARHEVGLRLATCRQSNDAAESLEFEVLFSNSRTRWHRGQIGITK